MKTYKKKIKTILQKSVICFVALSTILSMTSIPYLAPLEIKTAQATTPTILVVEQVNPSAVEVIFSEAMDETTAQNIGYYTFANPALNVIDAILQGPNIVRVVASGEITAGVGGTTLTVSASVITDPAGTANTSTDPQTIVRPVRVKISEVSAEMGSADSEFIELYNSGSDTVDISSWTVEYSAATPVSWSTLATIGSVAMAPGSFYLLSTTQFNATPSVNGDANFIAGLDLAGGHIRIVNSSSAEIDKIGWGTAASPEGTAITAHSASQSFERKAFGGSQAVDLAAGGMDETMGNGWDTNDNSFDFVVQGTPNSQNSSSTAEQQDFSGGGGPMINHMPVNSAITGFDLEITAQMGDPATAIENIVAELHYMIGDGSPTATEFTTILGVHQSNGFFKFTIPVDTVNASTGANGLYYYLKVVTDGGTGFMSASAAADTGTYDTVALQEAAVAVNPFIISVAGAGTTYVISGTVTDDTSTAIESVLVMIEGTGYSATTNASGVYSISVPNGIYNLTMIKDGYFEEWISDVFVNGVNETVNRTMYAGTGGGIVDVR